VVRRVELKKQFVAIDFSKYKGRYVAVVGKRVVASGTNAKQVWLEAKKKDPTARPELHKIPKDDPLFLEALDASSMRFFVF
jgi:hypothetical protein